ncbi:MAG TPA: outer membrane beta-barrel protein [Draconibacterium sp.]|jgi:opacity protein-like surface antigen|nr:outer membrane beta-barrel protein [Draconibacterium sp.]
MKNQNIQSYAIAFLIIVSIFSINPLKAQSEFGVKGGLNFSKFKISNDEFITNVEQQFKNGLTLGMYYQLEDLIGPVGLRTELLYQSKGSDMYTENYQSIGYGYSQSSWYRNHEKLHYITLPLLFTFSPFKNIEFYAGNHVGFMVSYKCARPTNGSNKQRFAYGWDAGAIFKFNKHSSIDLRYSADLTRFDYFNDISKSPLKNYGFEVTYQHTIFKKQNN